MKILVFSDLHGSLNALKELIKTYDFKYADKRIFLGDVAFGCSRPIECLKLIQQCDCECILGNNDFYITDYIPKSDEKTFNQNKMIQFEWMKKNIGEDGKKILKSWKKDITLKVGQLLYKKLKQTYPEKQIIMTRSTDKFLSLGERTDVANSVKLQKDEAVIYVSVHVNALLS